MDGFYEVVAYGGAALVIVMGLWTAIRLHAERPFSTIGTLMAGAMPVLSLVIYAATLDVSLKTGYAVGLLVGGAAVGTAVGAAIPLHASGAGVVTRASGWHLVLPWVAMAALQVMGVRESFEGVVLSLAALYASVAFTAAASAVLIVRGLSVRPATAAVATGVGCSACGSAIRPDWCFCMNCGAPV